MCSPNLLVENCVLFVFSKRIFGTKKAEFFTRLPDCDFLMVNWPMTAGKNHRKYCHHVYLFRFFFRTFTGGGGGGGGAGPLPL